jgi:hypothetical protein
MTKDHDDENKNGAEGFLAFIEESARIALSSKVEKVVDPREKAGIRRYLASLRPAFEGLQKRLGNPEEHRDLWQLTVAIFSIGSCTTRSKSATRAAMPIIRRAFRPQILKEAQSKRGKNGGLMSGKVRLKAVTKRRNQALDLAKAIRGAKPNLSQQDLAGEIEDQWNLQEPCHPSMLVPLIRKWEEQGKLVRRRNR